MMNKIILSRIALAASVSVSALTFGSTGVRAQSAPPADSEYANEIVVMATRRSESLQDVPMSIDVATGEKLQQLNIFDAKDVQQLSPGLQLQNSDGRSNKATLRGVSFDPDQGTDPSVDVYVNEVPSDAQNSFTAIYDVAQIEVLRGPQGALRGRTSPGGAITIRTRRANLTEIEGYVQATATERRGFNVQGAWSAPLITDKLGLRLAALVDGSRINQVRNVNRGGDYSRGRTVSARATLTFSPTPDIDLNLTYQYLHADNRQNYQVFGPGNTPIAGSAVRSGPPAEVDDYLAVHDGQRRFQNRNHQISLNGDWDMGPVTLSVVGGYQDALLSSFRDLDEGNAIPGYSTIEGRGEVPPTRVPYIVKMGELRLASNNEGFFNWGVSAYYHNNESRVTQTNRTENFANRLDAVPDIVAAPSPFFVNVVSKTKAIAGNVRLQFTDKLRLEAAGRYTDIQRRQVVLSGPTQFVLLDATKKAHPLTGAANLTYEFSPEFTGYLAYGRSFRLGSSDVGVALRSAFFGALDQSLIMTDNERSDSYEAGVKMSLLDRRLSFNAAVFYQKFDGYITRVRDIPARFGVPPAGAIRILDAVNANADASVKGIEGTLSGAPTPNWDFSVSAAYVKARYDDALIPCRTNLPGTTTPTIIGSGNISYCASNGRLSDVPDFTMTANSEYRFGGGSLQPFVRALVTYRPSVYSETSNFRYRSQQLVNLFAGVRSEDGRWEVNAFVRNLLDQNRVTFASPVENFFQPTNSVDPAIGGSFVSGYRLINATNPREFGLSAMFKF